ncbi:MAG: acyl carrier protein [Acidobacteria bacterium]|nr:acyl carrier protein [Acidobacteriota bacterium]
MMTDTRSSVEQAIEAKIIELARAQGHTGVHSLSPEADIPETGWLDSASLMELVMWYESTFGMEIPQEDFNLDNFGTIRCMADYLERYGKL